MKFIGCRAELLSEGAISRSSCEGRIQRVRIEGNHTDTILLAYQSYQIL